LFLFGGVSTVRTIPVFHLLNPVFLAIVNGLLLFQQGFGTSTSFVSLPPPPSPAPQAASPSAAMSRAAPYPHGSKILPWPSEEERYWRVLEEACLLPDLELLAEGHLTDI
jgi:hypothetical protein